MYSLRIFFFVKLSLGTFFEPDDDGRKKLPKLTFTLSRSSQKKTREASKLGNDVNVVMGAADDAVTHGPSDEPGVFWGPFSPSFVPVALDELFRRGEDLSPLVRFSRPSWDPVSQGLFRLVFRSRALLMNLHGWFCSNEIGG